MPVSKNFISRILEGTLLTAIAFVTITYAYNRPFGCWFFSSLIIAASTTACWEYCRIIQQKGIKLYASLLLVAGCGYMIVHTASLFSLISTSIPFTWLLLALAALSIPILKSKEDIILPTACTLLGFVYIFIPTQLLLDMTYSTSPAATMPSRWWLIWTLLIVKGSDSAAYFGGKLFGKRPLTPISPKKTWEGFFIGCFIGASISWLMGFLFDAPSLSPTIFFLLGGIVSAIACIGDLIESRLKREVGIKDSNSIPGLGGFLDMADSLLFVIPFSYLCFILFGSK